MNSYERKLKVEAKHLDDLKHVNNVVYLQWVQETAGMHWFKRAGRDTGVFWVVRKHEIEYFKPAFKNDELRLITWVEEMRGLSSMRRVEIRRGEDLICSCLSNWIMLDAETMRPKRIPDELAKLFLE